MIRTTQKITLLALISIILLTAVIAADPVEGYWKSVDEEGEPTAFWQIEIRGGRAFGRILTLIGRPQDTIAQNAEASYPNHPERRPLNTLPVIGVEWIYNMQARNRPGQWTRGFIIDPEDGRRYALDLNVLPPNHRNAVNRSETLEVKGKILVFSRSQYWVRSSRAEVDSFRE